MGSSQPQNFSCWSYQSILTSGIDAYHLMRFRQITNFLLKTCCNFVETQPTQDKLSSFGLELLTSSWLSALAVSQVSRGEVPELDWIFDSGLYDSIKDGSVKVESEL